MSGWGILWRGTALVAGGVVLLISFGLVRAQELPVAPPRGFCGPPNVMTLRLSLTHSRVLMLLNKDARLIEFWVGPGGSWVITTYTASRGLVCIFDKGEFSRTMESAPAPGQKAAQ